MDKIKEILLTDDRVFASFLLGQDFLSKKINNKEEIIRKSMECGFSFAKKYINYNITDLLAKFDLEIIEDMGSEDYSYYELAFFKGDKQIHLCKNNIIKIKEKASSLNLDVNVKDIILSHEVFHKIEEENKGIYTDNVYIESFKLGPINKMSKLKALSEIGAMSFTKKFLSLSYNPLILDYLLALAYNKEDIYLRKISNYRRNYES